MNIPPTLILTIVIATATIIKETLDFKRKLVLAKSFQS